MRFAKLACLAAVLSALAACDSRSSLESASQRHAGSATDNSSEIEPVDTPDPASFCAQPTGPDPKSAGLELTDGVCPRPKGDPVSIFVWAAPQLTGINLSASELVLDRWGDSATIDAQPVDQNGSDIDSATIVWSSEDDSIAAVDNAGNVTSWLGGDVELTVEASLDGITVTDTVDVAVAIQQNQNCTVPTEFPAQGPVNPASLWDVRRTPTRVVPPNAVGDDFDLGRQIRLDFDRDGDPDILSMANTPEGQGIGVPIYTDQRIWLNDGNAGFTDGTAAILGQNTIPWSAPRWLRYADFDADGFEDVVVFQQGWEFGDCGQAGGCPGGPNLLFLTTPGGLSDSAPTGLNPYDVNFTHSGATGDVDCDGDIDIFEANWGGPGRAAIHHLKLNSGNGTFVADDTLLPVELQGDLSIQASAMCDLDRDGDPDLVTHSDLPGAVRIAVNDGFGRFRMLDSDIIPALLQQEDQMECGDLNQDGHNDLLIQDNIIRNLGNMAFVDISDSSLPPNADDISSSGLAISDLNGDDWPEILPLRDNSVYWNTGGGVFERGTLTGQCCNTKSTIADFDSDGHPDIYLHTNARPTIFLNRPPPAPVKKVFATSSLHTADLGGLTGADAICQQRATEAGLAGTFVAFLSNSATHALNRLSHGEFRRAGDNSLIASSKMEFVDGIVFNAINEDENGATITADERVWTGTDHEANRREDTGVGFCSDWTRATNENPGLAATGSALGQSYGWVWSEDRNCSEPQRLYCFQQ